MPRRTSSVLLLGLVAVAALALLGSLLDVSVPAFAGSFRSPGRTSHVLRHAGAGYLARHLPKDDDPPLVSPVAAAGATHEVEFKKRPTGIFRYSPGKDGTGAVAMDIIQKSRYPGDPTGQAFIAGVQEGWVLRSVNGQDVTGMPLEDIMDLLDDEVFMGMHQALTGTAAKQKANVAEKATLPMKVVFQEM
mmetsp:Transcript_77633/g.222440  ORF Transcript_77633/g.222440 Transcript_77633/m.222440 type:complete len:190 (+) Transcript_77633:84-653(+)|eukprot:CAMPEP_0177213064 /NCGR_PEP_ID=MMETSP0367-20130122/32963_1 /TAXON_ID=447022 ORGANISM="Scrippsiella hangoei-like, Strain SHHI-4" /NCGR_SAMPLE_ID=MMETSP0367 /ASSEMBLY_ACC=CAM_ASM_000362 /LENGTH=189 /DNA_ID=CAMNT_0018662365 /DNA_START=47 /DNA_END=616 /DNA_ORIENTATION=+